MAIKLLVAYKSSHFVKVNEKNIYSRLAYVGYFIVNEALVFCGQFIG